jgi:hypothetical protein
MFHQVEVIHPLLVSRLLEVEQERQIITIALMDLVILVALVAEVQVMAHQHLVVLAPLVKVTTEEQVI